MNGRPISWITICRVTMKLKPSKFTCPAAECWAPVCWLAQMERTLKSGIKWKSTTSREPMISRPLLQHWGSPRSVFPTYTRQLLKYKCKNKNMLIRIRIAEMTLPGRDSFLPDPSLYFLFVNPPLPSLCLLYSICVYEGHRIMFLKSLAEQRAQFSGLDHVYIGVPQVNGPHRWALHRRLKPSHCQYFSLLACWYFKTNFCLLLWFFSALQPLFKYDDSKKSTLVESATNVLSGLLSILISGEFFFT